MLIYKHTKKQKVGGKTKVKHAILKISSTCATFSFFFSFIHMHGNIHAFTWQHSHENIFKASFSFTWHFQKTLYFYYSQIPTNSSLAK